MANCTTTLTVFDFPDDSRIAGTTEAAYFTVYDSGSVAVDLATANCYWYLYPMGDNTYTSASKIGTPVSGSSNIFEVTYTADDTLYLGGSWYVQEAKVVDFLGKVFKRRGKLFITPALEQ